MLWLIIFIILLFILMLRNQKVRERLQICADAAEERRYEYKLRKEWENAFPDISKYEINEIFEVFGKISVREYFYILFDEIDKFFNRFDQILALRKHFNRMLWRFINSVNRNKSIREILRKQIKVIDDEELIFAF